jgi:hypothetical protein
VSEHRLQTCRRFAALAAGTVARVGVRVGEQPAEVAPAVRVAHEQRQVAPVGEVELGAVDRAHPAVAGGLRELHRAGDGVVVGQRERGVAELVCALDELGR